MRNSNWFFRIAVGALMIASSGFGQALQPTTPEPGSGNREVANMLRAHMPEATIVSEIETMAGRGVTFDLSPSAMIMLQQAGASERVLNAVLWAQNTVAPGVAQQMPRGVFYNGARGAVPLHSFVMWAEITPRWSTWPFYSVGGKHVALSASPAIVQVSDATPSLLVQGYGPDANWELVSLGDANGRRTVRLRRKHAFDRDFFSDEMFERGELTPVTLSAEADGAFSIRPTSALNSGAYALCGGLPEGGWTRVCYEFQVNGGGRTVQ